RMAGDPGMSLPPPPWSDPVRLDRIGAGVERELVADAPILERVQGFLDLASLDSLSARVRLRPYGPGWRLSGRVRAELAQTCGITLEPLPLSVDREFEIDMVEASH